MAYLANTEGPEGGMGRPAFFPSSFSAIVWFCPVVVLRRPGSPVCLQLLGLRGKEEPLPL